MSAGTEDVTLRVPMAAGTAGFASAAGGVVVAGDAAAAMVTAGALPGVPEVFCITGCGAGCGTLTASWGRSTTGGAGGASRADATALPELDCELRGWVSHEVPKNAATTA